MSQLIDAYASYYDDLLQFPDDPKEEIYDVHDYEEGSEVFDYGGTLEDITRFILPTRNF